MKASRWLAVAAVSVFLVVGSFAQASDQPAWLVDAESACSQAFAETGLKPGDANLLFLTNAGYGRIGSDTTEAFIDVIPKVSGCTIGNRSLLPVHSSVLDPLWFSIFRKDTGKLVFVRWTGNKFEQQVIDALPEKILTPKGWADAASGVIGPNVFGVVSLSLSWAEGPPWPLLVAAMFHDHFCPGVNAGYLAGEFLKEKLPLGPGDKYVFVTAPGKCAADALQVMYNATAGKSSGFTMTINKKQAAAYQKGNIPPFTVAMRVNAKKDVCDGLVLGFDWPQAYKDTGVTAEEHSPKGGPSNPMFWVSRAKMSMQMAKMPLNRQLGYIVPLKSFAGKAGLAGEVSSGDPYAIAWK
jgi:formylmethanofuran dehydrogenase subunit E-like metal-binding protein